MYMYCLDNYSCMNFLLLQTLKFDEQCSGNHCLIDTIKVKFIKKKKWNNLAP